MNLLLTLLSLLPIIFGFGLLIFIHELGHFVAARWAGIRTEGFAVGMGPVACAWRRGLGFTWGSTDQKTYERFGKTALAMSDEELRANGIGETEYSLRWLPIGGFVKMLGQDDANPAAVSDDPRSYQKAPIYKRMIVVSAGVIMNVLLAIVLFMIAFLNGVEGRAPVVGIIGVDSPALDAGIQVGDRVTSIDGKVTRAFSDIQIAAAMAKPGQPLEVEVERRGSSDRVMHSIIPVRLPNGEILSIGVGPATSTTLEAGSVSARVDEELAKDENFGPTPVRSGWTLNAISASDETPRPISIYEQTTMSASTGILRTDWTGPDGQTTSVDVPGNPGWTRIKLAVTDDEGEPLVDSGVAGLIPPARVDSVLDTSPNGEAVQKGDVLISVGDSERWLSHSGIRAAVGVRKGETAVPAVVLRGGEAVAIELKVSRKGTIGVLTTADTNSTRIALVTDGTQFVESGSVIDPEDVRGARFVSVNGTPVGDWRAIALELIAATNAQAGDVSVPVVLAGGALDEPRDVDLVIPEAGVTQLQAMEWSFPLSPQLFATEDTILSADGDPLRAISMGFHETVKSITLVYVTIDRLFRGSVGVDQLRGPVGIIDLGVKILPQGLMYFLFFLGLISVNLAVINFLPLPIVDGGLFIFLIYEKFTGRPPSIAFQNATALVGLMLIGTIFIVTFYNDIMRLIGGV